ncbi:hypothetical protein LZ32DRAFT_140115 [Colletotrichum eremochloae]|nr:hypothetical protein LZ32DRAFT_140115 [Colletotrichum eremochloae]
MKIGLKKESLGFGKEEKSRRGRCISCSSISKKVPGGCQGRVCLFLVLKTKQPGWSWIAAVTRRGFSGQRLVPPAVGGVIVEWAPGSGVGLARATELSPPRHRPASIISVSFIFLFQQPRISLCRDSFRRRSTAPDAVVPQQATGWDDWLLLSPFPCTDANGP